MDAEDIQHDPLRDAREAALRRIGEMRQRSLGASEPAGPDLRTLLARSERHVDELRRSASELAAILPTRVEAAVARALGEDEGGLGRRLDEVLDQAARWRSRRAGRARPARRAHGARRGPRGARRARRAAASARCAPICARCGVSWPNCRPSSASRCTSRSRARRALSPPPPKRNRPQCACARASRTRVPPRARASTHPDTPSSHPRLDPSPAAPPSWRHAGTSSGKRRGDRAAGSCAGAGCRAPARRRARSDRPLAASIGHALSGAFGPGARPLRPSIRSSDCCSMAPRARTRTARRCSTSGRSCARASAPDRPTPHSPRSCARSSLARFRRGRSRGPPATSRSSTAATEDAWLRARFHPGVLSRFREFAASIAGKPGAVVTLIRDAGLEPDEADGIEPGHAAGDVVAELDGGRHEVVLRRRAGAGFTVIAERARLSITGGTDP